MDDVVEMKLQECYDEEDQGELDTVENTDDGTGEYVYLPRALDSAEIVARPVSQRVAQKAARNQEALKKNLFIFMCTDSLHHITIFQTVVTGEP
jgi:hypothetical protein